LDEEDKKMSPFSGGSPGSTSTGGLQLPGGFGVNLPNINIGGGGGSSGGGQSALPNGNQLQYMLPLLALLGLAGVFPQDYSKSGTSDTTTDTTGKTTLDTFLKTLSDYSQQTAGTSVTGVQPTLSPATQQFMDTLIGRYTGMSAPSLTGYSAQQTGNINTAADVQRQAVQNILAARGLSTSPVAATAEAGVEQNRLAQITNMMQGLPILKNQMDLQNLAGASAFFGAIPKGSLTTSATGQTTTGTTSGTQTGTQTGTSQTTGTTKGTTAEKGSSGGGPGGLFAGLGAGLAYLMPYLLQQAGIQVPAGTGKVPGTVGGPGNNPVGLPGQVPVTVPGDEGVGAPPVTPPAQNKIL
jgi:hypothetical protein